ncbi:MAG: Lrp/AsnC family transcriptional regulator [Micrococcales bacterium]|nr:Lrp/AsnC family transcriptional regulator [Micrococcales bacterium]
MITTTVHIDTGAAHIPEAAQHTTEPPDVSEPCSVTGEVDLIAFARMHEQLADIITDAISESDSALRRQTHIAFHTRTHHDLNSAFILGLDDRSSRL